MTKLEILSWLEGQKVKTDMQIKVSMENEMRAYYDNIFTDRAITETCDELQDEFAEMTTIYEDILDICKSNKLISSDGWSFFRDLY